MTSSANSERLSGYYRWHARVYDATRWAFLFGRTELIRRAAQCTRPARVLEVGCGTGTNLARLARIFPDAQIAGVDLSPDMLLRARRKLAHHRGRVSLHEGRYPEAIAGQGPFDLIVLSYSLSTINPGFAQVLQACQEQLTASGTVAIVDFHQTRWPWFRRWMGVNHVRMDGQILAQLRASGLASVYCDVRSAYGGLWRWLVLLARRHG